MDSENRREYLRIADSVKTRFTIVDQQEATELAQDRHARPSVHNIALIKALQEASRHVEKEGGLPVLLFHKVLEMDQKLDAILHEVKRETSVSGSNVKTRTVDLGAGGCSIPAMPELQPGAHLDLTLHLQTFPPLSIRILGRVIRLEAEETQKPQPTVGIHFDAIHEEDREMLYHYIFQRQREHIRQGSRH